MNAIASRNADSAFNVLNESLYLGMHRSEMELPKGMRFI